MKFVQCEGFGSVLAMRRFDAWRDVSVWKSPEGITGEGKQSNLKPIASGSGEFLVPPLLTPYSQAFGA